MRIVSLLDLVHTDTAHTQIDDIFYQASVTRSLPTPEARAAYRDLWLGRYMAHFPELFLVALDADGAAAAYLAASPVSDRPPLPGPDYYALFPAAIVEAYPAHLHINVRLDSRGAGVGAKLVAAFRASCHTARIPAFHAVTAAGTAAVHFFRRCGMEPKAQVCWRGRELLLLGDMLQ